MMLCTLIMDLRKTFVPCVRKLGRQGHVRGPVSGPSVTPPMLPKIPFSVGFAND